MPTKRYRRSRHLRADPLPDSAVQRYLVSGAYEHTLICDEDEWEYFITVHDVERLRKKWALVRADLLAAWIDDEPGSRPWAWWVFDAPKEPLRLAPGRTWRDEERTAAHRRRLGGIGTPEHEVWGSTPRFRFGIPEAWFSQWQVEYYSGRAVDIHGKPIGQEFRGEDFAGVAPDPRNPPRFESEAAYLDRHGLFVKGERARLAADAFEPEVLAVDDDEGAFDSAVTPPRDPNHQQEKRRNAH